MANIRVSIAAATAVLDYDLFKDEPQNRQPYSRRITAVGCVGSAAAGDAIFELLVGGVSHGRFENVATGSALTKDYIKEVDVWVPANAQVQAIVRDAPGTNPLVAYVEFGKPTGGKTRRWTARRTTGSRWTPRGRQTRSSGGMY